MSSMFEAIRKDNGEPIAGTLVELKGRSFILPEGMGTIGLTCEGFSTVIGEYTDTIISGFIEVLPETVLRNVPKKRTPAKKKRKYYRKCGVCGERHEQSDMIRTNQSPNGWICEDCYRNEHPEYDIDEW